VYFNTQHEIYSSDIDICCVQRVISGTILLYRLERQPLNRTIVGSCTYDVGFCPVGSCRPSVYPSLDRTAYHVCPVYSTVLVDCGVFGWHKVRVVKCCSCCEAEDITVKGIVHDSADGTTLPSMHVMFDGEHVDITNDVGKFQSSLSPSSSHRLLTIRVRDRSNRYADAVKSVDIPLGSLVP